MTSKLREAILNADDIGEEVLTIPEWKDAEHPEGVTVIVRGMEAGERNDMIVEARDPDTKRVNLNAYYGRIVQVCTLDPDTREQVFAPDDAALLRRKSAKAVDRVAKLALELSGLGEDDADEAVKAAGKDSSPTTSDVLSTPSPSA